jgi:hypothetical protein
MTVLLEPLDILDAAIEDILSSLRRKDSFFYYERSLPTAASVVYSLHYHHMGSVKLIKRDNISTEFLIIERPRLQFDLSTPEQLADELRVFNQQDGPRKQYATEEDRQKLIAFYRRERENHSKLVDRYEKAKADLVEMLKERGLWIEEDIEIVPPKQNDWRTSAVNINAEGDVKAGGDVVGRDNVNIVTNVTVQPSLDSVSQQGKQREYLVGRRLRNVREDVGLQPSEFIELVGFQSEKEYLQMESNEIECPEYLIDRIFETTGVLPEWLKHASQPKYNVDPRLDWFRQTDQAVRQIASLSTGLQEVFPVYVTTAVCTPASDWLLWRVKNLWAEATGNYLHVGVCVPIAKHKYKVFDTQFRVDSENYHLRVKYFRQFHAFLRGLYDCGRLDTQGIILPSQADEIDLYKGRVHPRRVLFRHKISRRINWLSVVLDARDYPFNASTYRMCGGWLRSLRNAFQGLDRET